MKVTVKLVQWGMGMREGTVLEWHKQVGDWVAEGEELVEVESDKVTQDMTSPAAGRLVDILVEPGQTIPVRTPIAVLES